MVLGIIKMSTISVLVEIYLLLSFNEKFLINNIYEGVVMETQCWQVIFFQLVLQMSEKILDEI